MIITADEYRSMGFYCGDDDKLLQSCLKRAEFIICGLTGGAALNALSKGGTAADYVKQAAGFQASALLRAEEPASQSGERTDEKVTLGDFSYSSSASSSRADEDTEQPIDTSFVVVRLLRAAGCMFGGLEARE